MPKLISASPQQVLYVATWELAHTSGGHAFVMLSKCHGCFFKLFLEHSAYRVRTKTDLTSVKDLKMDLRTHIAVFSATIYTTWLQAEKWHIPLWNFTHIIYTHTHKVWVWLQPTEHPSSHPFTNKQERPSLKPEFDLSKWNRILIFRRLLTN